MLFVVENYKGYLDSYHFNSRCSKSCFYILADSGLNELFQMDFSERDYICTNIYQFL